MQNLKNNITNTNSAENIFNITAQAVTIQTITAQNRKYQRAMPVGSYSQFHILRLFDVLPNFPFTTSETMGDYYLYTWFIRVAS